MNKAWLRMLSLAALCAVLGGCGATPSTEYYVLSAQAPVSGAGDGPSVGIAELAVAEYLQRDEMVLLQSPNRLSLQGFDRWAEPLEDGVRRTLALNLGALLGSDRIRVRPWTREWSPQWLLRCRIERLDIAPQSIELVASWSLQNGEQRLERSSRLSRERSGASPDSAAADISALVLELGQQIAAQVRAADDAPAQTQ
jgi:uncharacterized protein